jgi:hypothetical protein
MANSRKNALPGSLFTPVLLLLLFALVASSPARAQGLGLGAQVTVTETEGLRFVGGFVETASQSPLVLCTLNENSPGFDAVRLSGFTLLCRQRTADFGAGEVDGVAILVVLPATFRADVNEELALTLTVFQEAALFYGDVQSCQGQCF